VEMWKLESDEMARKNENEALLAYLHQFVVPGMRAHEADHDQLRKRLADLEDSYRCLAQAHSDLQKEYAALKRQLADIDTRFTNIAGMWSRENHPGKQTENDNRHHDLAAGYQRFLQGEVFPLVISSTRNGTILPAADQAIAYSKLNHALFKSASPAADSVRTILCEFGIHYADAEVEKLCQEAARITTLADELGRDQRWDFDLGNGRFDPERQERYPGSANGEPDEVVSFVVAPGYSVGESKLVVRQQVFTKRAADRQIDSALSS
jgi:hypothetical protein